MLNNIIIPGDNGRRNQNIDSHNRLFGEVDQKFTPAKNHFKSNIPIGGVVANGGGGDSIDSSSVSSTPSIATNGNGTNGHVNGNGHAYTNGNGIGGGESVLLNGNGVKHGECFFFVFMWHGNLVLIVFFFLYFFFLYFNHDKFSGLFCMT